MTTDTPRPRRNGLTRRQLFRAATVTVGASGLVLLDGAPGEAANKISKQTAHYQDSPKDGHHCSQCTYYLGNNKCAQVAGHIDPNGWCLLWMAKKG